MAMNSVIFFFSYAKKKAQVGVIGGVLPGFVTRIHKDSVHTVSLGWCIRRGTRGEGDGDADYLPPTVILTAMNNSVRVMLQAARLEMNAEYYMWKAATCINAHLLFQQ